MNDTSITFDLIKSVVERTVKELDELEKVGGIGRFEVYDEFLRQFRWKAYIEKR